MGLYLMFGKYSPDSIQDISSERTDKAHELIKTMEGLLKPGMLYSAGPICFLS